VIRQLPWPVDTLCDDRESSTCRLTFFIAAMERWALTRPEETFDLQLIRGHPVFDLIRKDFSDMKGKKLKTLGF